MPHLNKDRLLYKSYEEETKTYKDKNNSFISYIISILNNIGMSNIWITQLRNPNTNEPKTSFMKKISTRIKDISIQSTFDLIQNSASGKLNFLRSLKDTYQPENYIKKKMSKIGGH